MKENHPKKRRERQSKKEKKEIRETEFIKKSKLDDQGCGTNLNSQKSFDKLYKDKFTLAKYSQNIFKKMNKKDKNDKMKKDEIEIFKLKEDKYNKKDAENEIKKIQEKYGVDEEDYLKTDVDDISLYLI